MKKGLVSIVTPCYNGEKFLDRFLNSILNQNYNNIEMIFIDDGSTDKTKNIVEKYEKEFEKKDINFTYIYQENAGQATAMNKGLPLVKGEFLVWPDADDYYENNAIEKMVNYLLTNQEKDYVRANAYMRNDSDLKNIIKILSPKEKSKRNLFENYIFVNDIHCFTGPIMIRMDYFDKVKKERKIFETRAGQNWQIILPIAYKGVAGFIDEPLYNVVVRENSHSRKKNRTLENEINRIDEHMLVLKNVLTEMNLYEKYSERLENKYNMEKMDLSLVYNDRLKAKYYASLITEKKYFTQKQKMKIIIASNVFLFYIFKEVKKFRNILKGIK